MPIDPRLTVFERAFGGSAGSCRRSCECGREFYNPDGGWSWENGELEALAANPNATSIEWSVGTVEFEGRFYVPDCTCWHERALKIIAWMEGHVESIAEYFKLENKRRSKEAARFALIEPPGPPKCTPLGHFYPSPTGTCVCGDSFRS